MVISNEIDKRHIKRSFSRAADTYDLSSSLQSEVAARLVSLLKDTPEPGEVLDLGCGTGNVLRGLNALFPDARIVGLDIAGSMLKKASRRVSGLDLLSSDMEALPFRSVSFDLVTSSLALQWATEPGATFSGIKRVLKPGGSFLFSTFSEGTLSELKEVLGPEGPQTLHFLSAKEIEELIHGADLEVVEIKVEDFKIVYSGLFDLLRVLKRIGAASRTLAGVKTLARGAVLKGAALRYGESFPAKLSSPDSEAGIVATYSVLYCIARRAF